MMVKVKSASVFFDKIRDAKNLQKIILTKVNKEVYDKVVESVGLRKKNE